METILICSKHDLYPGLKEEIKELAQEADLDIIREIWFNSPPNIKQYATKTIIEQIKEEHEEIEAILIPVELKPRQYNTLAEKIGENVELIDRVNLLLQVFEKKADSYEAKLEIQLAKLKYLTPRLQTTLKKAMTKERAGFFSSGEMKREDLTRDVKRKINNLEKKLEQAYQKTTKIMEQRKKKTNLPLIPILGFYSTGKTTVFNYLTDLNRPTGEKPFVTMAAKIARTKKLGLPIDFADSVGLTLLPLDILDTFRITFDPLLKDDLGIIILDLSRTTQRNIEEVELIKKNISHITKKSVTIFEQNKTNTFRLIPIFTKIDKTRDPKEKAKTILKLITTKEEKQEENGKNEIYGIIKENAIFEHDLILFSNKMTSQEITMFQQKLSKTIKRYLTPQLINMTLKNVPPHVKHKLYEIGEITLEKITPRGEIIIKGVFYSSPLQKVLQQNPQIRIV